METVDTTKQELEKCQEVLKTNENGVFVFRCVLLSVLSDFIVVIVSWVPMLQILCNTSKADIALLLIRV